MKSFFRSSRRPFYLFIAVSTLALSSLSNAHKVDFSDVDTLEKLVARVTPAVHEAEELMQQHHPAMSVAASSRAPQEDLESGSDMASTVAASMVMLPSAVQSEATRAVDTIRTDMQELTQDMLHYARKLTGMAGLETADPYVDDGFHTKLGQVHKDIRQALLTFQSSNYDPTIGRSIGAYIARAQAYVSFYTDRVGRLGAAYKDVFYKGASVFRDPTIYEEKEKRASFPPVHFAFLTVPPTFASTMERAKDLLKRMYRIMDVEETKPIERSPLTLPEDSRLFFDARLPYFRDLPSPLQVELRRIMGPYAAYYNIPPEEQPLVAESPVERRERLQSTHEQTSRELQNLLTIASRRESATSSPV